MQATTLTQLTRIAQAGANKIIEGVNYTVAAVAGMPNRYRITNAEGTTYRVNTTPGATSCGCKFYNENRFNKFVHPAGFAQGVCTCKHIEYLREREQIDAQAAQYAEREYADFNVETGYLSVA